MEGGTRSPVLTFLFILRLFEIGARQGRKIRLLINPVGGKGNGVYQVNKFALPVFTAAGCEVDVIGALGAL